MLKFSRPKTFRYYGRRVAAHFSYFGTLMVWLGQPGDRSVTFVSSNNAWVIIHANGIYQGKTGGMEEMISVMQEISNYYYI